MTKYDGEAEATDVCREIGFTVQRVKKTDVTPGSATHLLFMQFEEKLPEAGTTVTQSRPLV